MKTSFELEALARSADMQGSEALADRYYALANEAREEEQDAIMVWPRNERYKLYGQWCEEQRRRWEL